MKKNKYVKQTESKELRKIDNVIFYVIFGLLIALPLMQLIRMEIVGNGNFDLYYSFHCGYLLLIALPALIVCYLITIFKYHQKITYIDWICFALILIGFISTMQSSDIKTSFMGTMDRYEGLFSNACYYFILLCMYKMKDRGKSLFLINLFICLGILQSLYAFGQVFFRTSPFLMFVYPYMANALCGNPNYLGSYLLVTSLLSIYFSIYSNKYQKFYYVSSIICTIGLVLAQSTVPYLAFLIGLFSIVIYTLVKHKELLKKSIIVSVISLLISLVMVYVSVPLFEDIHKDVILPNYTIKDDLNQIFNLFLGDSESVTNRNIEIDGTNYGAFYGGRTFIWKNALKMSDQYFWLGFGYDNMGSSFEEKNDVYIDKAHNNYFNLLISNGIFALLLFIALFAIILVKGFKSKQLLCHLISIMMISFLIHWFFTNSVIEVTPYFMMVCGVLLGLCDSEKNHELIYVKE